MLTEENMRVILDNIEDGVYCVDIERKILYWNKAAEKITGYTNAEIIGRYCHDNLLGHINNEGTPLCFVMCPLVACIAERGQHIDVIYLRHKKGYRIPVRVKALPLYDGEGQKIIGAIEIFTALNSKVYEDNLIQRLEHVSNYDKLTSLPNRRYLESFIEYKIEEYMRLGHLFCIVFADIDNFHHFNDSYGHAAGDGMLISMSKSIQSSIRSGDLFGRWGGEEFLGVFMIKDLEEVHQIGERIRVLAKGSENQYNGKVLSITLSIGITVVRKGDTIESIVERADQLMYESKRKSKNCVTTDVNV